ncbi:endospore germination permease [Shouchella sp. 1P09AA]|uniref:GerAB/ArcD/ProY family transporter n=1 Tax=unclassified Shouchella TaxID=2893065 RepID=UPI00399F4F04
MEKQAPSLGKTQLFWFFVHAQIGVGLFSLPNHIYEYAQSDGWLSLLLAAVIVQGVIYLLYVLHKRFPHDTLFTLCEKLCGKWIGKVFIVLLILYFVMLAGLVLKGFTQLIAIWILNKTPESIFMILFLAACLPMLFAPLKQIGRMLVLTAPIVLTIPIIAGYAFIYGDYLNLLPIGIADMSGITKGIFASMFAINGFIVVSVVLPHVGGTAKEKFNVLSAAHWSVTLIYVVVLLTSFLTFSHGEMKLLPEPFLYMIKSFSLTIIERLDLLFLSFWSISIITTYVIFVYCGSIGMMNLLQTTRYRIVVISLILCTTIVKFLPTTINEFSQLVSYINKPSAYLTFLLPVLLVLLSMVRKKEASL